MARKTIELVTPPAPITALDIACLMCLEREFWQKRRQVRAARADMLRRVEQGAAVLDHGPTVRVERRRRAGCTREYVVLVVEDAPLTPDALDRLCS